MGRVSRSTFLNSQLVSFWPPRVRIPISPSHSALVTRRIRFDVRLLQRVPYQGKLKPPPHCPNQFCTSAHLHTRPRGDTQIGAATTATHLDTSKVFRCGTPLGHWIGWNLQDEWHHTHVV
jgi:hypothetical protein